MAANVIRVSLLADASKMKAGLKDADRAVATTEKSMGNFGKAAVAGFRCSCCWCCGRFRC